MRSTRRRGGEEENQAAAVFYVPEQTSRVPAVDECGRTVTCRLAVIVLRYRDDKYVRSSWPARFQLGQVERRALKPTLSKFCNEPVVI
ncbi:hypothetical protein FAIPA1_10512 [Frankia sp. AiPs1]